LSVRLHKKDDAVVFFEEHAKSHSLDLQQRAGEVIKLCAKPDLCDAALAPLSSDGAPQPHRAQLVAEATEAPLLDMTDPGDASLLSFAVQRLERGSLLDVLAETPTPAQVAHLVRPFPGSVEAVRQSNYRYVVYFEIQKNPRNEKQIAIRVSVFNWRQIPLTNFSMTFGVPPGWRFQEQKPSGNVVEPIGGPPVLQQLLVTGESDVKLQIRIQFSYQDGTQPIQEDSPVNDIFG
jgi:hypothetical protein